jgi:hypothetical protein
VFSSKNPPSPKQWQFHHNESAITGKVILYETDLYILFFPESKTKVNCIGESSIKNK